MKHSEDPHDVASPTHDVRSPHNGWSRVGRRVSIAAPVAAIGLSFAVALFMLLAETAMAAKSWGIKGEEATRFEARVVDIACELTGNCPPDCGAGSRQMGLLRPDGTLVFAVKNGDNFAGAAADLAPLCGKHIMADGLLIPGEKITLFALQFMQELPDGTWSRADGFSRDFETRTGQPGERWFEHDAQVRTALEAGGVLGIPGLAPPPAKPAAGGACGHGKK